MENDFRARNVLVTGACGSIGKVLIEQLVINYEVRELTGIDNNESELFFTEQHFGDHQNTRFFLADVRDRNKMLKLLKNVDIVFQDGVKTNNISLTWKETNVIQDEDDVTIRKDDSLLLNAYPASATNGTRTGRAIDGA